MCIRDRCDSDEIRLNTTVSNRGCEVIPEGTTLGIRYNLNEKEYTRDFTLTRDLGIGSSASQSQNFSFAEFDGATIVEYEGALIYDDDTNSDNNEANSRTIRIFQNAIVGYTEDFSGFELETDPIVALDNSSGSLYDLVEYNGNEMVAFSGDDRVPSGVQEGCDQIFKVVNDNRRFLGELELCVDATGIADPLLTFDMTQFVHENNLIIDPEHTSVLRLSVSHPDFEDQYIFGQTEGAVIKQYVQLPANFHDKVLLEAFTLSGSENLLASNEFSVSDNILIDNLELTTRTVSTDDQFEINQFKVSPNPTADRIWFVNEVSSNTSFDVEIYDALGSKVGQLKQQLGRTSFNSSNLQSGIYFYKIRSEAELIGGGKFVKKKN